MSQHRLYLLLLLLLLQVAPPSSGSCKCVEANVAIVFIISLQPLESMLHHHSPDSEVSIGVVGALFPSIITSSSDGSLGRLVANAVRS